MSGVLKRILENVAEAAERGAQQVAKGGEELHGWVKSGEARKALGKLGRDAAEVAREAREALAEGAQEAGAAVQEGVQALREGLRGGGGGVAGGASGAGGAREKQAGRDEVAPGEEQLSEDDRAALRARQRAAGATVAVRCTHCDAEVQVPADAELVKCQACGRRFWIELAERD